MFFLTMVSNIFTILPYVDTHLLLCMCWIASCPCFMKAISTSDRMTGSKKSVVRANGTVNVAARPADKASLL